MKVKFKKKKKAICMKTEKNPEQIKYLSHERNERIYSRDPVNGQFICVHQSR